MCWCWLMTTACYDLKALRLPWTVGTTHSPGLILLTIQS